MEYSGGRSDNSQEDSDRTISSLMQINILFPLWSLTHLQRNKAEYSGLV